MHPIKISLRRLNFIKENYHLIMTNSSYKPLISLAIMASGSGSNAAAIVKYFEKNKKIKILGIWTNSTKSGIARKKLGVPIHVFEPIKDDKNLIETMDQRESFSFNFSRLP